MKNIIFLNRKIAIKTLILLCVSLCIFLVLLIWSLIDGAWINILVSVFLVALNIVSFLYFRKIGFYNRIVFNNEGFTIRNGAYKEDLLFSWDKLKKIQKIRRSNNISLKLELASNEHGAKNIYTDNVDRVLKEIKQYKSKHKER